MSYTPHLAITQEPSATKASLIRGYATVLRSKHLFDQVVAKLSPESRRLLLDPPPASVWLQAHTTDEITVAIADIVGNAGIREILREASIAAQMPTLMSMVSGLLRLFGASPHTLYARTPESIKLTNRGVYVQYEKLSEKSARVVYRDPTRKNMPECLFHGVAGGLEIPLILCKAEGSVSDPQWTADGNRNAAQFVIQWK